MRGRTGGELHCSDATTELHRWAPNNMVNSAALILSIKAKRACFQFECVRVRKSLCIGVAEIDP